MIDKLKSTRVCYGEEVQMMRVDDCIIFGNKDSLRRIVEKMTKRTAKVETVEKPTKNIKGKWQRRKGSDCWECSQCHAVLENDDLGMHNFYFCYHCGANMMNKRGYMDIEEVPDGGNE